MSLDVLFRSIGQNIRQPNSSEASFDSGFVSSLQYCDASEAQIMSANSFIESIYGETDRTRSRAQTPMSRAQTPMIVRHSLDPPSCPGLQNRRHREMWHIPSRLSPWNYFKSPKKSPAKSLLSQETSFHHIRKPPPPRPSTFVQNPDVSSFSVDVDDDCEYAVLVSMYEVYNDRIFDLLSGTTSSNGPALMTRQGAAIQKGLLRRPLLFKNTEMSPDRKVVAGLRKIVCGTYEEAMMVLETGLTERRVAGTGSNSVSSRSHGFFCIEVKKNRRIRSHRAYTAENWTGGTLSIVDLAGSERARNAKTTGSTLAEAGKINESLMYLGQCLQVQSDCQHDGSKPIVPFRQCKLTELLFSNSFPSSSNPSATYKAPQKAVMIVTADPQGDFNATSQILRYSALAREVTIPRIPSVPTTLLSTNAKANPSASSGRTTPYELGQNNYFSSQELIQATNEVNRLAEECNTLAVRLAEEEIKRTETELKLQAAEEKACEIELQVREECWSEMEDKLEEEKSRWLAALEQERLRGESYVDNKLEILGKTTNFNVHSDISDRSRCEELERENESLQAKLRALEQELQTRSPSKKNRTAAKTPAKGFALQDISNSNIDTNPFLSSLRARDEQDQSASPRKQSLRSSSATLGLENPLDATSTGTKKQRKLTTRKWDLGDPEDL